MKSHILFAVPLLIFTITNVVDGYKNEKSCVDNLDKLKVFGGNTAKPGEFPFMASIRNESNGLWGGASIINNKWLVTAGHCVAGYSPSNLSIVVGSNLISSGGVSHKISQIIVNPDYAMTADSVINDVALLQLEEEITFDSLTQPIKIGSASTNDSGVVLGWGLIQWGTYPDALHFLPTRVTSVEECRASWPTIKDSQLCTFTAEGEGVCCGDSGGPVVSNGNLVAIVSYGIPCALGTPDIYTRVASFTDWIESTMQKYQ